MTNMDKFNNLANLQIFNLYVDTLIRILLIVILVLSIWYLVKKLK